MGYLEYFGFAGNPFAKDCSGEALFSSTTLQEGLRRLNFFVESQEGIAMLAGEAGCGKSTLLTHLQEDLRQNERAQIIRWNFTSTRAYGLLVALARRLGERPRRCKSEVALQLVGLFEQNRLPTILAVDEAHLLPDETLQDLRLLVELSQKRNVLLLLCGQPTLSDRLSESNHLSLRQRICVRHLMTPLSRLETTEYVEVRLKAAGASGKMFDQLAIALIFEHSEGIPRQINRLATQSLLACAAEGKKFVDERVVQAAHNDIQRL
jgi:type II secretory pathway predicted ATPase ExeA